MKVTVLLSPYEIDIGQPFTTAMHFTVGTNCHLKKLRNLNMVIERLKLFMKKLKCTALARLTLDKMLLSEFL